MGENRELAFVEYARLGGIFAWVGDMFLGVVVRIMNIFASMSRLGRYIVG